MNEGIPNCFQVKDLDPEEIRAVRAMETGTASPSQQRLALYTIVNNFSRAHDVLFIPGHADQTSFLNGRAFVGAQILKCLRLPVGRLTEETENE